MKHRAGEQRVETGSIPTRVDDGLDHLLDVEQRLEARVRAAEAEARAEVEAARLAAQSIDGQHRAEVEAAARAEERADHEHHAAELTRIAEEAASRAAALGAVSDAEVLRRARRALAIVAGLDVPEAVRP